MHENNEPPMERLRAHLKLSKEQFAEQLGLSVWSYRRMTESKSGIEAPMIRRVLRLFGWDADMLLLGTQTAYGEIVLPAEYDPADTDLYHLLDTDAKNCMNTIVQAIYKLSVAHGVDRLQVRSTVVDQKILDMADSDADIEAGARLKAEREFVGWTVRNTAPQFGVGRAKYAEMEAGTTPITSKVLIAAHVYWGAAPSDIIHGWHHQAQGEQRYLREYWKMFSAPPLQLRRIVTLSGRLMESYRAAREKNKLEW